MPLKLGKTPARPNAIKQKFGSFFYASELPEPTLVFGKPNLITEWGMLGNDIAGCCVLSGAAHESMLLPAWAGLPIPKFTADNVFSVYTDITGYNPNDPSTDQGTDMQVAASYRKKTGIIDSNGLRHKIDCYVGLTPGNLDELALATYTLGVVGLGFEMPSSAMSQFDNALPWSPVSNSHPEGGHYVPCVGRNHDGNFLIVTWGRLQAVTPSFISRYMDEGVAYVSFEQLNASGKSPRGFDEQGLRTAINRL